MAALVGKLASTPWSRIIFGISNHTDNTSGDPFVGYDRSTYVATPVHDFLAIILGPWQVLIDKVPESFLWLFSCGALVNNAKSFANLCVLVAHFSAHLLLAFCELVLIQRVSIQQVFSNMLGQSYKLSRHSDIFLLLKHGINSVGVFKYCWTHSLLCPWGNFLPLQCPDCGLVDAWTSANYQKEYSFECKGENCRKGFVFSAPANSKVLVPGKTLKNAIREAHKDDPGVTLPSSLKKIIDSDSDSEKSDKEAEQDVEDDHVVMPEEREAAAHPKTALFYKKECNEWDVAQKLFKEEINDYDKAERVRKGLGESIKHRMGHAREWFRKMMVEQEKEVKDAMERWNKEGAPEDIQAVHESKPQSSKKSFSVSSDGIKEWSSTGFDFFAEWSKAEFYPTAQDLKELEIDDSDTGMAEPELILDEEGYAKLPSREGMALRGQQDMIRNIFHASNKAFTDSNKPVPWRQIVNNYIHYLDPTCVPETLVVRDPSHMRSEDVNSLWHHWEKHSILKKKLVIFINAKKGDKRTDRAEKEEGKKKKKMDYVEISNEEEFSLASSHSAKGRNVLAGASNTPASILFDNTYDERWVFLRGLSMEDNYLELVDATYDLAHATKDSSKSSKQMDHGDLPSWAKWSWKHPYLPKDIHESRMMLEADLTKLRKANVLNATSAVSVVLGLGMLFRECGHVIEYEEDEASSDTPAYLANSVLDVSGVPLLRKAVPDVIDSVVTLIEANMRDKLEVYDIEMEEEKEKEAEGEVEEEDKEEDKEAEEEEEEEAVVVEVKQTRRKRSGTQIPSRNSKRARTEPKVSSIRSKKPVKAEMRCLTRAR
ncbi:hypothetical protein EDD22DRAFT_852207 [Suillus occidentalis]|nr:hypothetical protein EDD22DRAFT_852207 [Suillus occidentalis]